MKTKKWWLLGIFIAVIGMSFTTSKIPVGWPVFLKVEVIDDYGNAVHGAKVQLFKTEEDYRKEESPVKTDYTNKSGKVTFKGLEPIVYYMLVRYENMDNNGGAVQTDTLKAGALNKVRVVIQ